MIPGEQQIEREEVGLNELKEEEFLTDEEGKAPALAATSTLPLDCNSNESTSSSTNNATCDMPRHEGFSFKGSTESFPQKLMKILSDDKHERIISWLPDGDGFRIHQKKEFADDILPQHFKACKYTSFTRKLNRWGFHRESKGNDSGAYFNRMFHRDKPELCKQMSSNSEHKYTSMALNPLVLPSTTPVTPWGAGLPTQLNPQQQQQLWQQQMQFYHMQQMQLMYFRQQQDANANAFQDAMYPTFFPTTAQNPMQVGAVNPTLHIDVMKNEAPENFEHNVLNMQPQENTKKEDILETCDLEDDDLNEGAVADIEL